MTLRRKVLDYWTKTERIVFDSNGDPQVHSVTCCCASAGAMRRVCSRAAGNKTPCRCYCHKGLKRGDTLAAPQGTDVTEPFAKTKHSKGVGPGYENMQTVLVMVGDRPCGQYPCFNDEKAANLSHELAETLALHLNTAARKYAADKIREAVRSLSAMNAGLAANMHLNSYERQMLARADAVERGEA